MQQQQKRQQAQEQGQQQPQQQQYTTQTTSLQLSHARTSESSGTGPEKSKDFCAITSASRMVRSSLAIGLSSGAAFGVTYAHSTYHPSACCSRTAQLLKSSE